MKPLFSENIFKVLYQKYRLENEVFSKKDRRLSAKNLRKNLIVSLRASCGEEEEGEGGRGARRYCKLKEIGGKVFLFQARNATNFLIRL